MKKPEIKPAKVKRIRVVVQLEGSMVDKDTALTEQSARDYLEMHFQCPKGLKAHVISSKEIAD